jgi:hypothetical protein
MQKLSRISVHSIGAAMALLSLAIVGCGAGAEVTAVKVEGTPGIQGSQWFAPGPEHRIDVSHTIDAAGSRHVAVQAVNGSIVVEPGSGSEVSIQAHVRVRAPSLSEAQELADQVEVRIAQHGDTIAIEPVYPRLPRGYQVDVQFELECPQHMALDLSATNGSMHVSGIEGALQLATRNGNIETTLSQLSKPGSFTTTNGSIQIVVDRGEASLDAATTNGTIEVELPASFRGTFDGATTTGRVRSEFELGNRTGNSRHLQGAIGSGGPATVLLRATNGDIRLEKR